MPIIAVHDWIMINIARVIASTNFARVVQSPKPNDETIPLAAFPGRSSSRCGCR